MSVQTIVQTKLNKTRLDAFVIKYTCSTQEPLTGHQCLSSCGPNFKHTTSTSSVNL